VPKLSPGDVGWVAGLFEGEGHIGARPHGGWQVVLVSTDLDVVLRFWALANIGTVYTLKPKPGYKPWRR
jgi:hypothetical protein